MNNPMSFYTDHWPPSKPHRVVLISGANTGIGYETVRALFSSDRVYDILLGCRNLANGEEAVAKLKQEIGNSESVVTPVVLDISSDESIAAAYEFVTMGMGITRLDVLINNAGANFDISITNGTMPIRAAASATWDVNVAGAHILTNTFAPLLLRSSDPRLLFNTSGLSSLSRASGGDRGALSTHGVKGWPKPPTFEATLYVSAKAALNMLMLQWKRILEPDGVKVWCISPGFLATGLAVGKGNEGVLRKMGAGEPSAGGTIMREVVEGKRDADIGRVVNKDGIAEW